MFNDIPYYYHCTYAKWPVISEITEDKKNQAS